MAAAAPSFNATKRGAGLNSLPTDFDTGSFSP
jgi:hypothetical protein